MTARAHGPDGSRGGPAFRACDDGSVLVLHGLWRGADRLYLWAEDSTRPARPPRRPGRQPRQRPHPFAVPHDELPDELSDLVAKAAAVSAVLLLPTQAGAPLASPELLRADDEPPARGPVTLRPWSVPMWEYDQDDALALLRNLDAELVTVGADLRHLRAVADFAADLVARGRLLPTVLPDGPQAVWRPVLTGSDAAWARSLALALPPAGRALAQEQDATAGPGAPATVARALDALVDAAARAALAEAAGSVGSAGAPGAAGAAGAGSGWRGALIGRQRRFTADPGTVSALANELAAWQREALGGAVRACFRLVEPAPDQPDEDGWRLEFALQATDEPSLLVDAERVWRSRGDAACARPAPGQSTGDAPGRAGPGQPALPRARRGTAHRTAGHSATRRRRRPRVSPRRRAAAGRRRLRRAAARRGGAGRAGGSGCGCAPLRRPHPVRSPAPALWAWTPS